MKSKLSYEDLDEQIRLYINGALSQEQIDELWTELIRHPEYMEYFRASVNLHAVAREEESADALIQQHQEDTTNVWPRLFIAAMLMISIAAGAFLWFQQQQVSGGPEAIDRIEIDIMRSTAQVPDEEEGSLQQALTLVADEQTDQAATLLDSLRERGGSQEVKTEATLTKAVIAYNQQQYTESRELFEEMLEEGSLNESQKERVHWYLTQSLIRLGEYDLARDHAEYVVQMDGSYYRTASSLLEQFE